MRFYIAILILCGGLVAQANAQQPQGVLIVASDSQTASQLISLLPSETVRVLQSEEQDSDFMLNSRALPLRHATYFVFNSSSESARLALFRERFQTHGAIAIDIRTHLVVKPRRTGNVGTASRSRSLNQLLSLSNTGDARNTQESP